MRDSGAGVVRARFELGARLCEKCDLISRNVFRGLRSFANYILLIPGRNMSEISPNRGQGVGRKFSPTKRMYRGAAVDKSVRAKFRRGLSMAPVYGSVFRRIEFVTASGYVAKVSYIELF